MVRYSKIQSSLWTTSKKFKKLSTLERYVYLYLLTCQHGNSSGIFRMVPQYAIYDLGIKESEFESAMKALSKTYLISFDSDNEVIFLHDYMKFNPVTNKNHALGTAKVAKECIESPVYAVWYKESFEYFGNYHSAINRPIESTIYTQNTDTDTDTKTDIDTTTTTTEEPTINPEQEKALLLYQQEIGMVSSKSIMDNLFSYLEIFSYDMIEYAIKQASANNVKKYAYIDGIFKNWINSDIKTMDEVASASESFKKKSEKIQGKKKSSFTDYEQRESVDYEEIAKKAMIERVQASINERTKD